MENRTALFEKKREFGAKFEQECVILGVVSHCCHTMLSLEIDEKEAKQQE